MPDDPRVQQLLERLLDSQATPEEVCGSCPELIPQVRVRWKQVCRARAELDAMFPPGPGTSLPAAPPDDGSFPVIPGYVVEALLGVGGMGIVFRARHLKLNRTVALKMALAGAYASLPERERFQREAEAVAALRHPNIVQIHDVGDSNGRPYLTMEYVEGGSLAQKLAGTPQPGRQAAALMATLAGAVHAAHQGGIIHRDLKPANVLLTADGALKITDFGLARRLDAEAGLTRTGTAVGTPSYMAPEQAQGKTDAAGPAADIYALGAILYELLTGRPPFRAETGVETLYQVISQDPVPPSRLNGKVPRDLETICLKCLQKDPTKRYPTAAEVAADLGRFLTHEPILARPTGRVERGLRWMRRRPAAAGLLAAIVLLVLVAGVGAGLQYQHWAAARDRQAQTDQEVRRVLEWERGPLKEAWQAQDVARLTEALAQGNRAVDIARSGGASAEVQQEAEAFRTDADERVGREKKNRTLLEAVLDVSAPQEMITITHDEGRRKMVLAQPPVDEQYTAAFRNWGMDVDGTAEAEAVARLRAEPDVVVQALIAALDSWMLERRRQNRPEVEWRRLFRLAEQLDSDERHGRLRALLVGESSPRPESVAGLIGAWPPWLALWELARGDSWQQLREVRRRVDPRTDPVLTVVLLAQAYATVGDAAGAEQLLREAVAARPDQVVLLDTMGKLLERQGPSQREKAIEYYRAARAQRPRLGFALSRALILAGRAVEGEEILQELIRQQKDIPVLYTYLGVSLDSQGKYGAAEAAFRKAADLMPDAAAYYGLGASLNAQHKYEAAEAAFRKGIDLRPDYAEAHNILGVVLRQQHKYEAAEAAFRKAIDLRPNDAKSYHNLGVSLNGQQKYGAAEAAFRKAIEFQPNLAEAYHGLGACLNAQQKHTAAEAACRKAIELQPQSADAYYDLGVSLNAQQKHTAAEAACRKAIELQPDSYNAHYNLASALTGQKKYAAAEAICRKAIELQPENADAYFNLGNALASQRKQGAAETAYRKAIDLKPDSARFYNNLGMILREQQSHAAAEAAFRKAIELQPDVTLAYFNLALELKEQAHFAEALAYVKKGRDLLPARDPLREQTQPLLQECQRYATLDARLPVILRGTEKPANAAEQIEFAQVCVLKKLYAAAAQFYDDAFIAEPKLAEYVLEGTRYRAARAAALAGCGQGKDADKLDEKQRVLWRRQALQWLRQDLSWWGTALDNGNTKANGQVRQCLRYWQADPDLASVRTRDALARLPNEERKQWERLWSDVDALLRRVSAPE